MKPSGKPDAGNLPVRFDEGDGDGEGRTISTLRHWSLVPCGSTGNFAGGLVG
jgi:hypothetical protein